MSLYIYDGSVMDGVNTIAHKWHAETEAENIKIAKEKIKNIYLKTHMYTIHDGLYFTNPIIETERR